MPSKKPAVPEPRDDLLRHRARLFLLGRELADSNGVPGWIVREQGALAPEAPCEPRCHAQDLRRGAIALREAHDAVLGEVLGEAIEVLR